MFKKKTCKKCGKKISEKDNFCPNCGYNLKSNERSNEEDFGLLGKDDSIENQFDAFSNAIFGGFNGKILGKMLNSALKMLEKEMQKIEKQELAKADFELYINGKKVNPKNINGITNQNTLKPKKTVSQINPLLKQKNLKKISKLPREEPSMNMKRLSDEVIYEMKIPGVKSIEDVIISKLENSIEVKAIAKDKVYMKLIPVNLPIKKYNFSKNKLTLYLDAGN